MKFQMEVALMEIGRDLDGAMLIKTELIELERENNRNPYSTVTCYISEGELPTVHVGQVLTVTIE